MFIEGMNLIPEGLNERTNYRAEVLDNGQGKKVPIIRVTRITDPGQEIVREARMKKAGRPYAYGF